MSAKLEERRVRKADVNLRVHPYEEVVYEVYKLEDM